MTNILQAISTIVSNDIKDVVDFYRSKNKINAVGDALELFIKDIFANTVITSLRIRGMWQIEHPEKVYQYLMPEKQTDCNFRLVALMRETKYQSFPIEDRTKLESVNNSNLQNQQVKIKSPDNPIKRVAARLISYQI